MCLDEGAMRGRDPKRSLRDGRESVYKAQVALSRKDCETYGHAPSYIISPPRCAPRPSRPCRSRVRCTAGRHAPQLIIIYYFRFPLLSWGGRVWPKTPITLEFIQQVLTKALSEIEYEAPQDVVKKLTARVTPVSSRTSRRATSPMKTNKNKNKRQASSSSDEGATCSDSTVVGSDSEFENNNISFTLVEGKNKRALRKALKKAKVARDQPEMDIDPSSAPTSRANDAKPSPAAVQQTQTTSTAPVESTRNPVSASTQADSGRGERAGDSGILGSPEVSARYSRIDKSKKRSFAPLERISHSRVQIQSASSPTRSESSRSGIRNESWSDLMEEIKPSHKAFWAVTKALKTEGYTPIPPLKKPDNSVAIDDAEIAECLADSIETQCSHASPPYDIAHISRIEEEVLKKTSLEPKDDLAPVSLSEIQTLVKSLNTRKAPGLDGISNKAIKCFSIPLLSLLVAIFKACIKNCYFPPAWKEAEVIGIHKPGKPRDLPASYRPISLLSGLCKLFEKILKTRLSNRLLGKGLIIDEQFGFRPAHSCLKQVLHLVEYVSESFETERSTVAVFFDVAKAFDRQTDISHLGMSALTGQDVLSEQEFLKAPPLSSAVPRTQTIYRDRRRLASTRVIRERYRALYGSRNRSTDSPSSRGPLTS
ncbi:Probable RNA-directed DNA polymerase from transposon BS [Eumeta japonica]|uniref:Probable RNA-directed DNA polymerase from transposon BS n=1 Tax=Eumeta variegata TaxID=151549 RepID=A0A4C1YQT8_EUMVA|nr:Probable RNA-directed DNA polymerase from transposon BS [Eumeta japonica]